MQQHHLIPFTFQSSDWINADCNEYHRITFVEDWGPFKKHQTFDSVDVNLCMGTLSTFDETGTRLLQTVSFKAVAVESPKLPGISEALLHAG